MFLPHSVNWGVLVFVPGVLRPPSFRFRVRSIEDRTMRPGVSFVRALLEGWKPAGGVDPSPPQHVSRGVIQQRR